MEHAVEDCAASGVVYPANCRRFGSNPVGHRADKYREACNSLARQDQTLDRLGTEEIWVEAGVAVFLGP